MSKTNSGLIAYAKAQLGKPYWWGAFGQIASGSLYASKKKQYPSYYTAGDFASQYGRRVHDCIGLIKGYLWSDSPSSVPKYNASQDKSASMMYLASTVRGVIGTFDYVPGRLIYKGSTPRSINHVGVYIGGGRLIEAKGHAYGVVEGAFKPSEWTFWGQCPYIEADTKADTGKSETQEYKAPADAYIHGVDLSDIQYGYGMILPDFLETNKDKIQFVFIKCSRAASSVNASFRPWAAYLHEHGIPWGAYHFLNNDGKKVGGAKEADFYLKYMEPYIGEAVLALDYEGADLGFAAGTAYAKAFLDRVRERTGISPLIYTQQSAVHTLGEICAAGYPLWAAKYGKNEKRTDIAVFTKADAGNIAPYKEPVILQYSSNTFYQKYADKVDTNIFWGTVEDFIQLAKVEKKEVSMVDVNVKMPRLQRGSKGKAVKVWQTIVGADIDGSFGPKTEAATKAFQKAHGLTDDGIVGRMSWPTGLGSLS